MNALRSWRKEKMSRVKNTLLDLNDHLFMELERLGDEELPAEELLNEIKRAKAISNVADKIIDNANIILEAQRMKNEFDINSNEMPRLLEGDEK